MLRSPEGAHASTPRGDLVSRFHLSERLLHWVIALLFGICMVTAAALYFDPFAALVGRRETVKALHVYAGLAIPAVLVAMSAGRWGRPFRDDAARLNRWTHHDRRWLRRLGRDSFVPQGKFNAGQKLNAAFTAGAIVLLVATGVVMRWFDPFPLWMRTGSTFVHDWTAFALLFTIAGHMRYAFRDPDALRSMVRGTISREWAARHAALWHLPPLEHRGTHGHPSPGPARGDDSDVEPSR